MVEAVHNGNSTYCPFNMPHNPPEDSNIGTRPDYDPLALPLRTDVETRDIASKIVNLGSDKLAFQYGINKLAILAELTSLDMIRGFPPDEMHLYWENIIPGLVKHWRGNFTTLPCFTGRQATHTDSDDEMEEALESESASQERTKSPPPKKRKRTSGRADDRSSSTKFIETEDPWNIPPLVWSQIGRNMYDSHSTIPTQFGEAPRDFWEHSHHLKAAEWKNFAFLFLPVYLKSNLPDDDYAAFMELIDCIKIATVTGTSITLENIEDVRKRLAKFNQYYEARYYNHDYDRLAACLPVFHQLAHIADFLEFLGPMWAYSQWCMERMCGIIVKYAKNRFWANRNIEINLLLQEQRNLMPYIRLELETDHDEDASDIENKSIYAVDEMDANDNENLIDEDEDGTANLWRLYINLLKENVPNPTESDSVEDFCFNEPSRRLEINAHLRRCLNAYFSSYDDDDGTTGDKVKRCLVWPSCNFKSFKVVAANGERANSTRKSSYIQFQTPLSLDVQYGEVKYFLTFCRSNTTHHLAYVEEWILTESNGFVVKSRTQTRLRVIDARKDVRNLVGLVKYGNDQYIVLRDGPVKTKT
jgi:hypothetical protein